MRQKALRSFPNRYLFSFYSEVTSLFSVRYILRIILRRIKIYGNTYINLVPSGCLKIGKFRRPGNLPRSSQREGVQTTCTPIIMISVQASSPSLGEGRGSPPPLEGAGEAPYFTTFLVVPSLIFRIFIPGSMRLRRLPSVP